MPLDVGAGPNENGDAEVEGVPNPNAGVLSVDGAPKPKGAAVELPVLLSVEGAPKPKGAAVELPVLLSVEGAPKPKGAVVELPVLLSVVGAPNVNGEAPPEGAGVGVTATEGAPKSKVCALRSTSARLGLAGLVFG